MVKEEEARAVSRDGVAVRRGERSAEVVVPVDEELFAVGPSSEYSRPVEWTAEDAFVC